MKKVKFFLVLLVCCLLIMGCAESRILERISLVTLVGYDMEEDNITTTSVIRQINPEFESKVEVQSETNSTSKGTRVKVDMKIAKKLAAGQLRVVLFGDELAKNGLEQSLHTLMMNNELSTSVYLAVVKGTSKSLLEYPYKNVTDIGQHLYNLIDHNIKQQHIVSSTSHEIVRENYSEVRNFSLPIISRKGEFVEIDGIAFFSNGKMVGELPGSDLFYITMLQENIKEGTLQLNIPGETIDASKFEEKEIQIAVDSIKSKREIKVTNPETNEFNLKIKLYCRLLEIDYTVPIDDPKVVEKIEQAMNKKIESEISRILKYSQEINSDIYGFGEQYRAHVRDVKLTEKKWREKFKEMKVDIKVETEIIRNGVFE